MMAASGAPPREAGLSAERLAKVKQWQQHVVDSELLPSIQIMIWRNGHFCYDEAVGFKDEARTPVGNDTIFRWHSMTKPVTSVALMTLYEEGKFLLTDPLHKYLGAKWKKENMRVYKSGDHAAGYDTVPCERSITVKHILTHTSGLSYGFDTRGVSNKVDEIYHKEGLFGRKENPLDAFVDRLAEMPLQSQPGSAWSYSFSTDVCGRLIEVLSGTTLDRFLEERVFAPLGMVDTGFWVPEEKAGRLSSVWMPKGRSGEMIQAPSASPGERGLVNIEGATDRGCRRGGMYNDKPRPRRFLSGGGGLVGTAADYARFCEMLMLGGRRPGGGRVLSNKTLDWVVSNHLERGGSPCSIGDLAPASEGYSESSGGLGIGFGLGFEVILDAASTRQICSEGSFRWAGASSTVFMCDPAEDMFVVVMSALRFRNEFALPLLPLVRQVVYACIDDDAPERRARLRARSAL